MTYTLSPDQVAALQTIGRWYRAKSEPYITLGGYAGTGKTTLIAYLRQALRDNDPDLRVAFCAFTGKAVRVMEQTLKKARVSRRGDSITTMHGLMYHANEEAGGFTEWKKKNQLDYGLIIVDEASMVTQELWSDLLSFGIPVIAVGDHGQLPPIGGDFNLMAEPIIRLEKIYRQEELSPIVEMATLARTTGEIPPGVYGEGVVKYSRSSDEISLHMEDLLEAWKPEWLVLCGYNHTRVKLNNDLRSRMGFDSLDPSAGDRVICLRNNRTAKIYNGMTGKLSAIGRAEDDDQDEWWRAGVQFDDFEYEGYLLREQFGAKTTINPVPKTPEPKVRGDLFDFGYALTVHKAQGSQADTVLLFEERNKHMSDDDWRRWLYTAVTRAERQLFIIGD